MPSKLRGKSRVENRTDFNFSINHKRAVDQCLRTIEIAIAMFGKSLS